MNKMEVGSELISLLLLLATNTNDTLVLTLAFTPSSFLFPGGGVLANWNFGWGGIIVAQSYKHNTLCHDWVQRNIQTWSMSAIIGEPYYVKSFYVHMLALHTFHVIAIFQPFSLGPSLSMFYDFISGWKLINSKHQCHTRPSNIFLNHITMWTHNCTSFCYWISHLCSWLRLVGSGVRYQLGLSDYIDSAINHHYHWTIVMSMCGMKQS